MELNKEITADTKLGGFTKQIDANDKAILIASTNKYVKAKRSCGDVQTAFNELYNVIITLGNKYGFTFFDKNSNIQAIIDEFASKVEQGTNIITGGTTYSCVFNSVEKANFWLSQQKDIELKNIQVDTTSTKLKVKGVKFEYTVTDQATGFIYQLSEVKKIRFFCGSKQKKFNRKWQMKNPQYSFIKSIKRNWGFRIIGGSVGYFRFIREKYFVLYSFKNM